MAFLPPIISQQRINLIFPIGQLANSPNTMKSRCEKDPLSQDLVLIAKIYIKIVPHKLSLLTEVTERKEPHTGGNMCALTADSGRYNILVFCSDLTGY